MRVADVGTMVPLPPPGLDHSADLPNSETQTQQDATLAAIVQSKTRSTSLAFAIESDDAWQGTAQDRSAIIQIASHLDADQLYTFSDYLSVSNVEALDTQGNTLLRDLDQIATEPLNGTIVSQGGGEKTRSDILAGTLNDLSAPAASVLEGTDDTCATTSAEYSLIQSDPAEFARLMAGLIGPAGTVTATGGGDLQLQAGSFGGGGVIAENGRNAANAVFQSAAIQSALPYWLTYNPSTDRYELFRHGFLNNLIKHLFGGVDDQVTGMPGGWQAGMLDNLFGGDFQVLYGASSVPEMLYPMGVSGQEAQSAYAFLSKYTGNAPIQITYHFPSDPGWQFWKSHVVTFSHVDPKTGNVYFRDPAGSQPKPGDYGDGHVDENDPGLYYMTKQEFLDSAISVVGISSGVDPLSAD